MAVVVMTLWLYSLSKHRLMGKMNQTGSGGRCRDHCLDASALNLPKRQDTYRRNFTCLWHTVAHALAYRAWERWCHGEEDTWHVAGTLESDNDTDS